MINGWVDGLINSEFGRFIGNDHGELIACHYDHGKLTLNMHTVDLWMCHEFGSITSGLVVV